MKPARLAVVAVGIFAVACAHVTNRALCDGKRCEYDSSPQTTYRFAPKPNKNTLVLVTISGGGARAAALAFGTLTMLGQPEPTPNRVPDGAGSLLDQVEIISSVSGGSLTAGWYAVKAKDVLNTDDEDKKQLWDL